MAGSTPSADAREGSSSRWSSNTIRRAARGAAAGRACRLHEAGSEGNAASPLGTFPQAEAYDAARDVWTREPDMGVPRHGLGVAAVGGALYAMGGSSRQGLGPSGASEVSSGSVSDAGPAQP